MPVIAAVVLTLSGCAVFGGGSLDVGSGGFGTCAPVRSEGIVIAYGFKNKGQEPLTLTSVRLTDSKGLRLLESAIIPGHSGIGVMEYPLQSEEVTEMGWDKRKPVKGYVLDAGAEAEVNLAAGLEPGAQEGSYTGYVIDYVEASGFAKSATATGLEIYLLEGEDCPDSF